MTDRLNFYSPYERLAAGHENQLTRALLLLLRLSPLAHAEWLHLVAPQERLSALPPAVLRTQRRHIREVDGDEEEARLISVFLAPEQPQSGSREVRESDRDQVLDGIIDFDGELLIAVENKVFDADDSQARQVNVAGARVPIEEGQQVVVVLWRDLLEALSAVYERNLVAGAEAQILDDFLTYVEDHFPDLGPFRNLALCRRVPSRQVRRLRQVLQDATGREATSSAHGPLVPTFSDARIGANAYLRLADNIDGAAGRAVDLVLYPADTLTQAQSFYGSNSAINGLRRVLDRPGWNASPNFHFGHIQRGYCWTTTTLDLKDYLKLWGGAIAERGRSVPEGDWDSYWAWLISSQIAQQSDRTEFDRVFVQTNRKTATPRPGIALYRRWMISDAEGLDSRGNFVVKVRDEINSALELFDEQPLQ